MDDAVMKAVAYTDIGFDKLIVSNKFPRPFFSPYKQNTSQVLIRVHAAALNPADYSRLFGRFKAPSIPFVPGFDVSGVIVQTGKACKRLRVGDEVYADVGSQCGTLAEFVIADESVVALKPKNLKYSEAAALPLVGLTSYQVLASRIPHGADTSFKVLILGGSSGTGSFAVQYARYRGAHVTATCSTRNMALVRALGAAEVIDYTKQDWGEVLKGSNVDLIYDTVGGVGVWERAQHVLKPKGEFTTIVPDGRPKTSAGQIGAFAFRVIGRKFWQLFGYTKYDIGFRKTRYEDLDVIRQLVEQGHVLPVIDKIFAFDAVLEAFEYLKTGHVRGKVVVRVLNEQESDTDKKDNNNNSPRQQQQQQQQERPSVISAQRVALLDMEEDEEEKKAPHS